MIVGNRWSGIPGLGNGLGGIGSLIAAAVALWIAVTERRRSDMERQRVNEQQEADLTRQAGLVRVTAEKLSQRQAVGPSIGRASIGIKNRRMDRIFDVEVVAFVHQGEKMDLPVAPVNGFAIFPRREAHENWFSVASELPGLIEDVDIWLERRPWEGPVIWHFANGRYVAELDRPE